MGRGVHWLLVRGRRESPKGKKGQQGKKTEPKLKGTKEPQGMKKEGDFTPLTLDPSIFGCVFLPCSPFLPFGL